MDRKRSVSQLPWILAIVLAGFVSDEILSIPGSGTGIAGHLPTMFAQGPP